MTTDTTTATNPRCHLCGDSGLVDLWRADAYGPPMFHQRVCVCRFVRSTTLPLPNWPAALGTDVRGALKVLRREEARR